MYRWRQTIALAIIFLAITQTAHIALACGLFPGLDSGFARDSDLQVMNGKYTTVASLIRQSQLNNAMEKWCAASANPLAKRYQREQLEALLHDWADNHNGTQYPLPTCGQLGF